MLARMLCFACASAMAATPCLAAEIPNHQPPGERRSSAVAGAYFRVPLIPDRSGRARQVQAGLRLTMSHDYRTPQAPAARVVQGEGIDLRLTGPEPTLYLAGQPLTGDEGRRARLNGVGTGLVVAGAVIAAAVVGYFVLVDELSEGD